MLAQTIRENLREIQNYKMRNKTTKYSSLFSTNPTVVSKESKFKKLLMKDGLVEINEDDELYKNLKHQEEIVEKISAQTDNDEEEYIVENPDEVVVKFSDFITESTEEKLPFFKSISMKLAQMSC
jgi:hypothetical protein